MTSSVKFKLFEYCILHKIKGYIKLLVDNRQHGFRERYSTTTACFVLKETVLNYINSQSSVYACFIDISKAFDNVNHRILIEKLLEQEVPSVYVNMIRYFYANQKAEVRYGSQYSNEFRICNGVRQGGVLSGLLFNVYIDSLIKKNSK